MSPPGLLFLLLMSSCLAVSSTKPGIRKGTSLDEGKLKQESHRIMEPLKKLNAWFKKHYRTIGEVLVENVNQIPVVGPGLAQAIKTLLLLTPQAGTMDAVNSELRVLNYKIDNFGSELKWDAWAAGAYQVTVNNIEKAWMKYKELELSYQKSTNTEKEALKNIFFTFYSQYADSPLVLYEFLTAKPASITQNLGDALADRLRCHEKDVKAQFFYLNELMCKGDILNDKYYSYKGTNTDARVNTAHQLASKSARALIESHQRCLSNSYAYIERDIFERIDDTKKHQEIADSVMAFLAETYNRFDWMVVAFTTQHSKHDLSLLNRHTFSGFTEVQRGTVTVAVAKQVKGGYTKTAAVKEAIKKCLPQQFEICSNVVQKLVECQVTIAGKRLSQTFTAVHAYKRKSQTSTNAVEASDDNDFAFQQSSSLNPHLYEGKCGNLIGKFMVFIKSDEELMGKEHLCSKVNCGKNGKCVVVAKTFIAMCECQYPYYGELCKESFDHHKRLLQQELQPNQNPVPPAIPGRSVNGRSGQSASKHPVERSSRRSNSQHPAERRPQQSNSQRPTDNRYQQSNPQRPAERRPQQSNSQRPAERRPQRSNSQRPADNRYQQSNPQRPAERRPRQSRSKHPADRRYQKETPVRSDKDMII